MASGFESIPTLSVSCDSGCKPDARGICRRCGPSLSRFPRTSDSHFGDGRCPLGAPASRRHLVFARFARVPARRRRSQGRPQPNQPVDRRLRRRVQQLPTPPSPRQPHPRSIPSIPHSRRDPHQPPHVSYVVNPYNALRIGRRYDMAFCGACGYHRGSTPRAKASYGLGTRNFSVSTILRRRERIVPFSQPRFCGRSPAGVQRRNADRSEWLT